MYTSELWAQYHQTDQTSLTNTKQSQTRLSLWPHTINTKEAKAPNSSVWNKMQLVAMSLSFVSGGQCWGDWACGGVKAESQEALGATTAWLDHSQQGVSRCKCDSMLSGLVGTLPLPEEYVVLLQGTRVCKSCLLESSNFHVQSFQLIVNDSCLPGVLDVLQTCGVAGRHCPDIPTSQF